MRLKVVLGVIGAAVFTALIKRAVTPFYVPEAESILPSFEEVQPGLYSLQTRWKPLWGLLTVPTAIFAVKLDGDYLLVDSGGEAAEEFVADAVKHLLGSRDRLAAIFCERTRSGCRPLSRNCVCLNKGKTTSLEVLLFLHLQP